MVTMTILFPHFIRTTNTIYWILLLFSLCSVLSEMYFLLVCKQSMQMKQPFYAINDICVQAGDMWKLVYINGKTPLVFIFKVSILKFIEIISGSIKLTFQRWPFLILLWSFPLYLLEDGHISIFLSWIKDNRII